MLIIEDDASVAKLLSRHFEKCGFLTVWHGSGEDALAWLKKGDVVDIVVCDLGLPGMSGTQVVDALRSDESTARIPLIDRVFGHDRAMATHRSLGKPAIYLILAHAVFLIFGYGISEGLNPVAETISMWNTPDMPLAFIGTGLLLAVVVFPVL